MTKQTWLFDKYKNKKCGKYQRRVDHRFNQAGVLHTTENSLTSLAINVAKWQETQKKVYSGYHYLVDARGNVIYQCNPKTTKAYHAGLAYKFGRMFPGNNQIGVSMVAEAGKMPYHKEQHLFDKLLNTTAQLLVDIEKEFGIPIRKISIDEYRAGKRGWLGHMDVAYRLNKLGRKKQRKFDPGKDFPWDVLISRAVSIKNKDKIPSTRNEVKNMKPQMIKAPGPTPVEKYNTESAQQLLSVMATPNSEKYNLLFYREIAKGLGIDGSKPDQVAAELLKRLG